MLQLTQKLKNGDMQVLEVPLPQAAASVGCPADGFGCALRCFSERSIGHRLAGWMISEENEDCLRRAITNDPIFMGNAIAFWDSEKSLLLRESHRGQTSSGLIRDLKNRLNIADPLLRIINIELKKRLPELLLMRVDEMSMAQSI